MVCLQDAAGLAENTIVIPQNVFFIASMLNGENSIRDIQAAYMRQFGDLIHSDTIRQVIDNLDKNFFLEGERFEAHRTKVEAEFRRAETRPLRYQPGQPAGEPEHLRNEFKAYYSHPEGPGDAVPEMPPGRPRGVLVPHIDYTRGGPCYSWGYRCLETFDRVETILILGINHMSAEPPFAVTAKSFETPFGIMETDRDFVHGLMDRCDQDLLEGEVHHRNEHSIELQTAWLKFLFKGKSDMKIVPVLCGGFDRFFAPGISPSEDEKVRDFIESVKETIACSDRQICLMASVDLAHVGPQFGDDRPVSAADLGRIEQADLETLKCVEAVDREGFWQNVARDMNRRNICGLSAIYTFLSILGSGAGRLLKYSQWRDERGWGCVTFASMIFCDAGFPPAASVTRGQTNYARSEKVSSQSGGSPATGLLWTVSGTRTSKGTY